MVQQTGREGKAGRGGQWVQAATRILGVDQRATRARRGLRGQKATETNRSFPLLHLGELLKQTRKGC